MGSDKAVNDGRLSDDDRRLVRGLKARTVRTADVVILSMILGRIAWHRVVGNAFRMNILRETEDENRHSIFSFLFTLLEHSSST